MAKKTFSMKGRTNKDRKITLFGMVSIAILAVFNFNNVIDNYVGLGMSASFAFAIAVVVFLFPFIFIIAEFASLVKGSKSGLTSWIKTAVGRKTAFLTSFMFWFANLTYFLSAVPQRLNFLSFAVTGGDFTEDKTYLQIVPWASVIFFLIITFISTLNTKKLQFITTLGGAIMMGITVFFFLIAFVGWIAGASNNDLLSVHDAITEAPGISQVELWGESKGEGFAWISTFIWVLMAADGAQTLGVYVNDVKGGKKTFIRAMLISVCMIGFAYVLGTILVSVFPPKGGLGNGWANSFNYLFSFLFQNLMTKEQCVMFTNILMGWLFFISSIGGLLIWTSAPVKVMFSEIPGGVFGQKLSKENRNGVCSWGAWLQYFIVICLLLPLMIIPVYAGDSGINEILKLIKGAASWIGLLPWVVIFVAYLNLRWHRDGEERSFRMGPRWFGVAVGVFLSIITVAILCITFLDTAPLDKPYNQWKANWWLGPVLKVVMILLILVPAYLWYYFKFEYQIRDVKVCSKLNLSTNAVVSKYNISKADKYGYLYNEVFQEFSKKDDELINEYKTKIDNEWKFIEKTQDKINEEIDKLSKLELSTAGMDAATKKAKIKETKLEVKMFSKQHQEIIKEHKVIADNLLKELKAKLKENKINLWNTINDKANADKVSYDNDIQKIKTYVEDLKSSNKKGYKDLLIEDVVPTVEKDINWNDVNLSSYLDKNEKVLLETPIIYHYGVLSKKSLSDKLIITDKRFIVVNDHADDLVAREYNVHNVRFINYSKDQSIDMIDNGEWKTFNKVKFIYNDNTQLESFDVFVPVKTELKNKYFI